LRIGADNGINALSTLSTEVLTALLGDFAGALGADCLVLDFGTRLGYLRAFLEQHDAICVQVCVSGGDDEGPEARAFFRSLLGLPEDRLICAATPDCPEDIRSTDGKMEISLSNAFGLSMKEICDAVLGCRSEETDADAPVRTEAKHGA
jgi:hypothetical protein